MDVKFISNFHLVNIGKKLCTRQSSVCCQYGMIALTTNRKFCSIQVSDSGLKHIISGSMLDCKSDIDLRDGQIAHDSVVPDI